MILYRKSLSASDLNRKKKLLLSDWVKKYVISEGGKKKPTLPGGKEAIVNSKRYKVIQENKWS